MLSDKELAEFKRGPLQMLALLLLKEADMYGYQLNQELKQRSGGKFVVAGSVLYIVLYRLEEKGYISKRKEEGVKKAHVFYHLEPPGEAFLSDLLEAYAAMTSGVRAVIEKTGKGDEGT